MYLWGLHTEGTLISLKKIKLMILQMRRNTPPPILRPHKNSFKTLMFGNITKQLAYKISNLIAIMTQFCVIFKPELQLVKPG